MYLSSLSNVINSAPESLFLALFHLLKKPTISFFCFQPRLFVSSLSFLSFFLSFLLPLFCSISSISSMCDIFTHFLSLYVSHRSPCHPVHLANLFLPDTFSSLLQSLFKTQNSLPCFQLCSSFLCCSLLLALFSYLSLPLTHTHLFL